MTLLARALAAIAVAIGLTLFAAGVGVAVLWGRLDAAALPADQAIAVVPLRELIAIGAVALVGFVLAAIGALVAVYVLDERGTASRATVRGLVVLIVVEIGVAIVVGDFSVGVTVALLVAFAAAGVFLLHVVEWLRAHWRPGWWDEPGRWRPAAVSIMAILALGIPVIAAAVEPHPLGDWSTPALVVTAVWVALVFPAAAIGYLVAGRRRADVGRLIGAALCAYGVTALIRFAPSLAVLAAAALALGALNLAVAHGTGDRFAGYGACVFASVVVFGAALSYERAQDSPTLQPVAVLLKNGAPAECGLYVTETGSRLYMGRMTAIPRGDSTHIVSGSGRMFWLPREQIRREELGPLESVVVAQADAAGLRDELVSGDQPAKATGPTTSPVVAAATANGCVPGQNTLPPRETAERKMAAEFEPRLVVARSDGFWPTSVLTIFNLRQGGSRACVAVAGGGCNPVTRPSDLPWLGQTGDWLKYPGNPFDKFAERNLFVGALGSSDPARSAREYFLVTHDPDHGTTTIQYWFYYGYNYQRVSVDGVPLGTSGLHEGDLEWLGVLLSHDERPVYVWTNRHDVEGRPFVWPDLTSPGDRHVTAYAAIGSHATYDSCGTQHRRVKQASGSLHDLLADHTAPCDASQQLVMDPQTTRLSDLSLAPWACWKGAFGRVPASQILTKGQLLVGGPRSPLWQQGFDRSHQAPCDAVAQQPVRPDAGEEVLDAQTAATLRANAGRLDAKFDSCDAWMMPPARGAYVVACDPGALNHYFDAGLDGDVSDQPAISGPHGPREPASLPAVYRRPDGGSLDGVTVTAKTATNVRVYAACYAGLRQVIARFPAAAPVAPGAPLRLNTGGSAWTLTSGGKLVASVVPTTEGGSAQCG